jgi:hypothetical protein
MGVMDVDYVRGRSVAQRMTNVVGVDSVHDSIDPVKQAAGNNVGNANKY